ncbi:TIGR02117 family protein [Litoribacillus peritrichatus]|uniref:TIGR02117 family protein n=1 Tax=Litoribacillus peritrichatus TaxID=718191 RepID=A0ABP7N534_9GAMM
MIIVVGVLALTACSTLPKAIDAQNPDVLVPSQQPVKLHRVYIVSHGWHTGIVIPAQEIQRVIPELRARFGNTGYLEFGWGDKGFYQSPEITVGLTLQAIFWPTDSVVHTVAVPSDVEAYFGSSEVSGLCLAELEYAALVEFISESFARDASGSVISTKTGLYGESQFYTGIGNYHLMNTCNKWTAKGLQSAGLDISTTFKLTASSIMSYLADQQALSSGQGCR